MQITFEQWMQEVDKEIFLNCGLTSSDLTDARYYDMYDDEMDPSEVAKEVLNEMKKIEAAVRNQQKIIDQILEIL